jgi:hypothetical protein
MKIYFFGIKLGALARIFESETATAPRTSWSESVFAKKVF